MPPRSRSGAGRPPRLMWEVRAVNHSTEPPENQPDGQGTLRMAPGVAVRCPLPAEVQRFEALTADVCGTLAEIGCPLAAHVEERLRFETLLADLSATFVNLPPGEVDTQIDSALGRLVEFLGVDRCGLAEFLGDQKQPVITHSCHLPG